MPRKRKPGPNSRAENYSNPPLCKCGCGYHAAGRHYEGRLIGFKLYALGHRNYTQDYRGRPEKSYMKPSRRRLRPVKSPDGRRLDQTRFLAELILGRKLEQYERTKPLLSINKRKVSGIVIFTRDSAQVFTLEKPITVNVPARKRQTAVGQRRRLAGSPAAAARPCTV